MKKSMLYFLIVLTQFFIPIACLAEKQGSIEATESSDYKIRGHIIDENGFAIPNMLLKISHTESGIEKEFSIYTNEEGYFPIPAKGDMSVVINLPDAEGKINELFSMFLIKLNENPMTARREIKQIRIHFSSLGWDYNNIKQLYKKKDYSAVFEKGQDFLAASTFSRNRKEKYEVEQLITEARMQLELESIGALNSNKDFEAVIANGSKYLLTYKNMDGCQCEHIARIISEARKVRREKAYLEVTNNKIERENIEDYQELISIANAYLETYDNEEYNSISENHVEEVRRLISNLKLKIEDLKRKKYDERKKNENTPKFDYVISKYKAQKKTFDSARDLFLKEPQGKDEFQRRKAAEKLANEREKLLSYEGVYYHVLNGPEFKIDEYDFEKSHFSISFGVRYGHNGGFGIAGTPDILQIADPSGEQLSYFFKINAEKAEAFSKESKKNARLLVIYKLLRVEPFSYYNPLKAQALARLGMSGYENDVRAYIQPYYVAIITEDKKYILLEN